MILGTHNSITGMPASNLFGILFSWTSKCQDLTIEEQLAKGVRAFDLRIKRNRKGHQCSWILCHGFAEYNTESIYSILTTLNAYPDKIYVRLGLETTFGKPTSYAIIDFLDFISTCRGLYTNLSITLYVKYKGGNPTAFPDGTKFYELQRSPSNLWEVLQGPRRLLKYQKNTAVDNCIVYQDFIK